MAGYGVAYERESRINRPGRPEAPTCKQCEDTGFIVTATGLKECPLCAEKTHAEIS